MDGYKYNKVHFMIYIPSPKYRVQQTKYSTCGTLVCIALPFLEGYLHKWKINPNANLKTLLKIRAKILNAFARENKMLKNSPLLRKFPVPRVQ